MFDIKFKYVDMVYNFANLVFNLLKNNANCVYLSPDNLAVKAPFLIEANEEHQKFLYNSTHRPRQEYVGRQIVGGNQYIVGQRNGESGA